MTKRDETIAAIWRGIDPSAEGAFRIAAEQAAAAVRAMPFGTFADETGDPCRDLLRKYMEHVRDCEGIDFTDRLNDAWGASDVKFTDAECAELKRLAKGLGK